MEVHSCVAQIFVFQDNAVGRPSNHWSLRQEISRLFATATTCMPRLRLAVDLIAAAVVADLLESIQRHLLADSVGHRRLWCNSGFAVYGS